MSIAKHLHEDRIMKGGWRRIVQSPSRALWDGSEGWAKCPVCPYGIEWKAEEKLPSNCPRCGAWMVRHD